MKKKKINIAIVGLGNVGSNLYKHLIKNKKNIQKKTNVDIVIKYVSAKNKSKKRKIFIPKKKWLNNYLDAIGGMEKVAKVNAVSMLAEAEVQGGVVHDERPGPAPPLQAVRTAQAGAHT